MRKRYQNAFFLIGLAVLAFMVAQLDFADTWHHLQQAGYWFVAVVALWGILYLFNTFSWYIIIHNGMPHKPLVGFWWLYKITISGFALNYATPGGLMGGEPYRVMAIRPYVGTEQASSSVILFAMTHIFSHFWFWMLSVALFLLTQPLNTGNCLLMACITAFCLLGIWFFITGYKKGLAVRVLSVLGHIPGIRGWIRRFVDKHRSQLDKIDQQIAALHGQNPKTYVGAILSELTCRIFSALEIYFILRVISPHVNYLDCILILAFTSLVANLLFFIPLQLGGREGGFLMSIKGLGMTTGAGIFVALLVRLRELIWTAIGLLLIKLEKRG